MENCKLCRSKGSDLKVIQEKSLLETLAFLKNGVHENGEVKLCKNCKDKVETISSIKQETKKIEETKNDLEEEEEEDVNLEELDLLSSYYAEQDDDPDFVPNLNSKKVKKKQLPLLRPKLSKVELKCQLCDLTFSRVIALRRHFLNDHEDIEKSDWKCQECHEILEDKSSLISHFIKTHVAINQCKKCGKKFRLARSLRNHIANYCPQISGHHKPCDVCSKLMPANLLASHKAFSHICPNCNTISLNRREKCKHLREVHQVTKSLKNPSKSYLCKGCQQVFPTSFSLSEHVVAKHGDDTDLVTLCPHQGCKQRFLKGSVKLRSHLKKFHENDSAFCRKLYRFECKECFGRFKSAEILKYHFQSKHEDQKIKCPYCSYELPLQRKSDLYRHHFRVAHPELTADIIKAHDERLAKWKADLAARAKIQCLMCSFAGVKSSNMARHYVDVHGYDATIADAPDADDEMPDGALCTECGEIYINRHGLMRHLIKAHSKPGGEQCLYCPFRYTDVISHIDNVHAAERDSVEEQVCKKCLPAQKFGNFQDLLKHMRSYHRKRPALENKEKKQSNKVKKLCENCGKLALHKNTECPKLVDEDQEELLGNKKKYVPVHLSGTCPYCEYKFSDLLGHIRHGHAQEKASEKANICALCSEKFGSVRELVTHRQLHPQFKSHACSKCALEFETVVELRQHRAKSCTKSKKAKKKQDESSSPIKTVQSNNPANNAVNTLMMMANAIDKIDDDVKDESKAKTVDYEGRGTVACHLCKKTFILKTLLKRHYISCHNYDPSCPLIQSEAKACHECAEIFENPHEAIKHHLESHATISGQICPYCDCKYGAKKFDHLDSHVSKHHVFEMQSPMQTCSTCKINFHNYEALKVHRQIHEGGNRPRILVDVTSGEELISVHPRVGAKPEISNRGGLKCQLCNAFKLRKDHLKLHYIRHHGYDPKAAQSQTIKPQNMDMEDETSMQGAPEPQIECPTCHGMFQSNHFLIKHLLKNHCVYSGLICPYCPGHFPSRFIDLQIHVTTNHMDQLTGYNICNRCKVCQKQFSGYAELRDHVQVHGDGYKDSIAGQQSQGQKNRKRKQSEKMNVNNVMVTKRTKVLVPVAADANGQLRLTSEALQKAILMVTEGGQVENLPQGGLVLDSSQITNDPSSNLVLPTPNDFWP